MSSTFIFDSYETDFKKFLNYAEKSLKTFHITEDS